LEIIERGEYEEEEEGEEEEGEGGERPTADASSLPALPFSSKGREIRPGGSEGADEEVEGAAAAATTAAATEGGEGGATPSHPSPPPTNGRSLSHTPSSPPLSPSSSTGRGKSETISTRKRRRVVVGAERARAKREEAWLFLKELVVGLSKSTQPSSQAAFYK